MESSLSRITASSDVNFVEQEDSLRRRSENVNSTRSSDHVENRQQTVTQSNLEEILLNMYYKRIMLNQ